LYSVLFLFHKKQCSYEIKNDPSGHRAAEWKMALCARRRRRILQAGFFFMLEEFHCKTVLRIIHLRLLEQRGKMKEK
ncbi:MAG: hypothetical protein ACLTMW_13905, partial [Blautia hydrogenotrophica]